MCTTAAIPIAKTETELSSTASTHRLAWWLTLAAIVLRVYHFIRNPPVWCDERWILHNITGKTFAEQLGPLFDIQAAPPLFLWSERSIWLLFGDNIFALRMLPLLASCAAMLLLYRVGRLCMSASALPWTIFIFGFSQNVVDYTCEVKPYVIDAFFALFATWVFLETREWRLGGRLLLLTVLAPVVIFASYPGCFICGCLLLAFLPSVWGQRRMRSWAAYVLLALTVMVSFGLLYLGPIRAQHTATLQTQWVDYPTWSEPWKIPWWTLCAAFKLFEHFWRPTGAVFMIAVIIAAIRLWRNSRRVELALFAGPAILAMLAAWIGKYPFESRLILFTLPGLCLLAGVGTAELIDWLRVQSWRVRIDRARRKRGLLIGTAIALAITAFAPFGKAAYHLVAPIERQWVEEWPPARADRGNGADGLLTTRIE